MTEQNSKFYKFKRELFLNDLRDSLNLIPEDLSDIYQIRQDSGGKTVICAREENGWYLLSVFASCFHRKTDSPQGKEAIYNRKFVCPDRTGGSSEAVICFAPEKEPYLVTDPVNRGTYNFVSPVRGKHPLVTPCSLLGHLRKDVLPYIRKRRQDKMKQKNADSRVREK